MKKYKPHDPCTRTWTGLTLADAIIKDHVYARQTYLKFAFHYKSNSHLNVLREFCTLVQDGDETALKAWFRLTKRQKERIEECVPEFFFDSCLIVH